MNIYGGTPPVWIIDTASNTPVSTDPLMIDSIVWEAGTSGAAGDECKVTDAQGTPLAIFDVFGTGADFESLPRKFPKRFTTQGLAVPTLAHGKVWVYFQ